jgi:sigma-54 specific flagellar transcriptional regulator A
MSCLAANRWPGNVRELANLLERLAILYPDHTVTADDLPERYRTSGTGAWFGSGMRIVNGPETVPQGSTADAPATMPALRPLEALGALGESQNDDDCETSDRLENVEAANSLPKSGGIDLKDHLSTIEIGLIRKALEQADGTVAEAARLLNIRRTTLVEKLRKYRLSA